MDELSISFLSQWLVSQTSQWVCNCFLHLFLTSVSLGVFLLLWWQLSPQFIHSLSFFSVTDSLFCRFDPPACPSSLEVILQATMSLKSIPFLGPRLITAWTQHLPHSCTSLYLPVLGSDTPSTWGRRSGRLRVTWRVKHGTRDKVNNEQNFLTWSKFLILSWWLFWHWVAKHTFEHLYKIF